MIGIVLLTPLNGIVGFDSMLRMFGVMLSKRTTLALRLTPVSKRGLAECSPW